MYGIDVAHVQLISPGYRYEFADNQYAKVTIFIGQSDGQSIIGASLVCTCIASL